MAMESMAMEATMDDLVAAGRTHLAFSGLRSGDAPLTLGQHSTLTWMGVPGFEWYHAMLSVLAVPSGTGIDAVCAALHALIVRHESLRTTYPVLPDGERCQRVAGSGGIDVDLYEVPTTPDAPNDSEAAGWMGDRMRSMPFDVSCELPIRVALAAQHGDVRVVAVVYSHIAVDLASMVVLSQQFAQLVADPADQPPGHQPSDQAAAERSPRGQRRQRAALRYWEANLRRAPRCQYPRSLDDSAPSRALAGYVRSRAAGSALAPIARRTGVSPPMVALAALVAVLTLRTGQARCVLAALSDNRAGQHMHDYVGTLAQDGLVSVDALAPTFDELVRRTGAASLAATMHSLYPAGEVGRIVERVNHDRGIHLNRDCAVNNISPHAGRGPDPTAEDETDVVWAERAHQPVLVGFELVALEPALSYGIMTGDTQRVPTQDIEAILYGIRRLLVASERSTVDMAALTEITGVHPIVRGSDWLRVDSGWVERSQCQRLLTDACGAAGQLFAVPDPGIQHQLLGYVVASGDIATAEQAHAACLAALPDRFTAMAPHHYRVCGHAPQDPTDLRAWHEQLVISEGDGRGADRPPAIDPAAGSGAAGATSAVVVTASPAPRRG
jgi:Condensation domain